MRVSIVCQDGKHRVFETVEAYETWVKDYYTNKFNELDTMTATMSDGEVVT